MSANDLNVLICGKGNPKTPVVLLHGFGGSLKSWSQIKEGLAKKHSVMAYDLPGHAGSIDCDGAAGAGSMAKVILSDIERRGVEKIHLVGHSMGGAVASLIALRAPKLVVSLTLLAPGGFGAEINARLLARYALADNEDEMLAIVENMFGWSADIPAGMVKDLASLRKTEKAREILATIYNSMFKPGSNGQEQGQLPVNDLAQLGIPIKVVWGTQDRVLPTRQAHKLPGEFAVHVFDNCGHMLVEEREKQVGVLIKQNINAAG